MDIEPVAVSKSSSEALTTSQSSGEEENSGVEQEDPYSFHGPSIAVLGLTIAVATIAVPLGAVLNDSSFRGSRLAPAALESDGPKPSLPISLTRISKPGS